MVFFTRRLLSALWMIFIFAINVTAPQFALAADRPNILVLLADDAGWTDYGCYGNSGIRTPNIDALAAEGLLFRKAFLTTPQCSPSRCSVMTGQYPHSTRAEDLHMDLSEDRLVLPTHLKRQGYFTGHMMKTHYGPHAEAQFDWYDPQLDKFDKFLEACGEKPFFMWVGFKDPHRPYSSGAIDPPHTPDDVIVPPILADTPETRTDLALYYDEISRMDGGIGTFVAELKKRKLLSNTIIVFFSDNGMPFPRSKGSLHDSGIGTPLIISWPGRVQKGSETDALTSVVDLAPTFLEAAGVVTLPESIQGRSILPLLTNPTQKGRAYVFSERNWHNCDEHLRSVRSERYKLIDNAYLELPFGSPADVSRSPSWLALKQLKDEGKLSPAQARLFEVPRPKYEFYDLENDPWEVDNLAAEPNYKDAFELHKAVLAEWKINTNDFSPDFRRRADNTDRITGLKFTQEVGPMTDFEIEQ